MQQLTSCAIGGGAPAEEAGLSHTALCQRLEKAVEEGDGGLTAESTPEEWTQALDHFVRRRFNQIGVSPFLYKQCLRWIATEGDGLEALSLLDLMVQVMCDPVKMLGDSTGARATPPRHRPPATPPPPPPPQCARTHPPAPPTHAPRAEVKPVAVLGTRAALLTMDDQLADVDQTRLATLGDKISDEKTNPKRQLARRAPDRTATAAATSSTSAPTPASADPLGPASPAPRCAHTRPAPRLHHRHRCAPSCSPTSRARARPARRRSRRSPTR